MNSSSNIYNAWNASVNWRHTTQFNWCGCLGMRASWAMRGLTNWLRSVQTLHILDPSPYLAYRTACSSEQSGTGWRGNTHSAGSLAKSASTLRPSWPQQDRAIKLLNMSRQKLFVVTGNLGLNGHFYKIGKDVNSLSRR